MAKPDWVGVMLPEESSGNKQLTVICKVNNNKHSRNGVITIKTTNETKTAEVKVTQSGHTITYSYNIKTTNNCSIAHTNVIYLNWKWENEETHSIPNHLGKVIENGESQDLVQDNTSINASVGNIVGFTLSRTPENESVACDINLDVNGYSVKFNNKKGGDYMTLSSQIPITDTLTITGTIIYKDL